MKVKRDNIVGALRRLLFLERAIKELTDERESLREAILKFAKDEERSTDDDDQG